MIELLLIPYCAITARLSGMDMPRGFGRVPEIAFALPFAYLYYPHWYAVLVLVYAYFCIETGIEFLPKGQNTAPNVRQRTLSPVVNFIARRFKVPTGAAAYCAISQGVKGFVIGLAAFPFGLLLALGWPLSYYIGHKLSRHWISEALTGVFAGIVLYLSVLK
jgi:hypothetical protein